MSLLTAQTFAQRLTTRFPEEKHGPHHIDNACHIERVEAGERWEIEALPSHEKAMARDQLWKNKHLLECWSLIESEQYYGELPVQTIATKNLVTTESVLWHEREDPPQNWERFRA